MKKLALLLIVLLLLSACGTNPPADTTDSTNDVATEDSTTESTEQTPAVFALVYNGIRLVPGEVTDVIALLGEPAETSEAPSCVHEGNDIIYYYDLFEVVTSPSDAGAYISAITVYSDSVAMEEGITLGGNISDVIAVCPTYEESLGRYVFTRQNTTLTLMTDNSGIIIAMSYGLAE